MSEQIDARGLSCPQPVLLTMEKIKTMGRGELIVLVDTEASRENVGRAVQKQGWSLQCVTENDGEYALTLTKG
ncbi:MAG: tRNA 2-thiouridine synthesizing protein [Desulfovibrionales bacterium]|nr:tRNA 2-thiouridine synthesizing protein [Desulfovibrionales bacterium]